MALVELNGKCRQIGYCDCGGLLGCIDDESVDRPKHVNLETARRAAQHEIHHRDASDEGQVTIVECGRCDRSHMPTHPHITNPEGELKGRPDLSKGWTKDQPSCLADRIGARQPVAGGMVSPVRRIVVPAGDAVGPRRTYLPARSEARCEVCGVAKRSNHHCKGAPATGRIDQPVAIVQPAVAENLKGPGLQQPLDQELAAIDAILTALGGMSMAEAERILRYVADQRGINSQTAA